MIELDERLRKIIRSPLYEDDKKVHKIKELIYEVSLEVIGDNTDVRHISEAGLHNADYGRNLLRNEQRGRLEELIER